MTWRVFLSFNSIFEGVSISPASTKYLKKLSSVKFKLKEAFKSHILTWRGFPIFAQRMSSFFWPGQLLTISTQPSPHLPEHFPIFLPYWLISNSKDNTTVTQGLLVGIIFYLWNEQFGRIFKNVSELWFHNLRKHL